MSMLVAINAFENTYGGLHGMNSRSVIEVDYEQEAVDYAIKESYNVMNSYGEIVEDLEESVEFFLELGDNKDIEENIRDDIYGENVAYEVFILDKDKLPTLNIDVLDSMYYNNPDEFIEKYSLREID